MTLTLNGAVAYCGRNRHVLSHRSLPQKNQCPIAEAAEDRDANCMLQTFLKPCKAKSLLLGTLHAPLSLKSTLRGCPQGLSQPVLLCEKHEGLRNLAVAIRFLVAGCTEPGACGRAVPGAVWQS